MELCVSGPWALSRDTGVVRICLMEGRKSSSTLLCSVWRHNISLTSCLVVPPSPNKSRFWWNLGDFLYVYIIHLYLQVSRGQVILSTSISEWQSYSLAIHSVPFCYLHNICKFPSICPGNDIWNHTSRGDHGLCTAGQSQQHSRYVQHFLSSQ